MSSRLRTWIPVAACLVLVAGCGGQDGAPGTDDGPGSGARSSATDETTATGTPSAAPSTAATTEPNSQLDATGVTLLDAGEAPRTWLRLDPEPGHAESSTMTMRVSTLADGRRVKSPAISMTMRNEVTDVSESTVSVDQVVTASGASSGTAAEREQADPYLAPFVGLRSSFVITRRGEAVSSEVETPEGLTPEMATLVEGMTSQLGSVSAPVPAEAVGVGARWQVATSVENQGVVVDQLGTYSLVAIDAAAGTFTLEVEMDQQLSGASSGLTLTGTGTGSGTLVVSVRDIVPIRSSASQESTIDLPVGPDLVTSTEIDIRTTAVR